MAMPDVPVETGYDPLMGRLGVLGFSPAEASLPDWLRLRLTPINLAELAEVIVERDMDVAFSEYKGDVEFVAHLRASVRENLDMIQKVLCGRVALADVRLQQPLAFAAIQAQMRIPQTSLQRSYRVGFFVMWQEWTRQTHDCAAAGNVPRDEALRALAMLTHMIFGYQDHVASLVAETYARTEEAVSQSRSQVRQRLVTDLLNGSDRLAPSDLLTIGYDFEVNHVAILLPQTAEGAASQLLRGLRASGAVSQTLSYQASLGSTVLWLGRRHAWPAHLLKEVHSVLRAAGVKASLGEQEEGLAGFRRTLEQARAVERIRDLWGHNRAPRMLRHAEVELEILLMRDLDAAAHFVRRELGPLASDTADAARLCETLEASFRLGSHVAAAEHLGLHEHTVRNRLRTAEKLLGRAVGERRTEVQVALRLRPMLMNRAA